MITNDKLSSTFACRNFGRVSHLVTVREVLTCTRDADFQKFNARGEEIELIKSKYKQMEMLLESHDQARDKLEDEARWVTRWLRF